MKPARFLPPASDEPADEHEIKLRIEPRSQLAPVVERIEALAAEDGNAAHDTLAAEIGDAFGLDDIAGIKGIGHVERFMVYHDTRALDLYRCDASLRTRRRRNGKCRVNAKRSGKGDGSHGVAVRREWRYTLAPDVYDFLERARFRPLALHHFADLLGRRGDARLGLSPVVQIQKCSTRIELCGAGGERFLLSLDRFRGFDCRTPEIGGTTGELREVELEALNGKATRELASICDHMSLPPGVEQGRPKYQLLVEELGIESGS